MNKIITILLLCSALPGIAQFRAFDNSKAILPWIYNPTATFIADYQAYIGYDGRGTSSFTPQSIVAGLRVPLFQKRIKAPKGRGRTRRDARKLASGVMAVQLLNTKQDIYSSTTINISYAHRVAINNRLTMALGLGMGVFNMNYNYNSLVFIDQQDPLLNNGESFYSMQLNAGATFTVDQKLFLNIAAPYILKNNQSNLSEIIVRLGYPFAVGNDFVLTAAANLDTYNQNLIYGADLQVEWQEMISLLVSGDRYKYHVGVLFNIPTFALGYTYGQNFQQTQGQIQSHQISIFSNLEF